MRTIKLIFCLTILSFTQLAYGQYNLGTTAVDVEKAIPLDDLSAFKDPGSNWQVVSDAWADFRKGDKLVQIKSGSGTLINQISDKSNSHLVTIQEFGDLELSFDFMMVKGSNAGVYLQGRYEIQLLDSWKKLNPGFFDVGGVYQRWDESRHAHNKGFEGTAPSMNVAKAPGLWQHLLIRFRAPRFDHSGSKIANARFDEVYLNGVLVQEQIQVTGPTRSSLFENESVLGPIVFQGDHGNFALKNIRYKALAAEDSVDSLQGRKLGSLSPILVNPGRTPYLLRGFLLSNGKKHTHAISVGNPNQTNFSYDLKQGTILQFWRGRFMDATGMWEERGETQLAKPLGAVIPLSEAPSLARLSGSDLIWPDSIPFDEMINKGYTLDGDGNATFHYDYAGLQVADKILADINGDGLRRIVNVSGNTENLYFRISSGNTIEVLKKGLYAVDGKSYYIQVNDQLKPFIRSSAGKQELIVAFSPKTSALEYSIIW